MQRSAGKTTERHFVQSTRTVSIFIMESRGVMTANAQPLEEPGRPTDLPELQLKPGFKRSDQSVISDTDGSSVPRSRTGPLTFDEMLAFTERSPEVAPPQSLPVEPAAPKPVLSTDLTQEHALPVRRLPTFDTAPITLESFPPVPIHQVSFPSPASFSGLSPRKGGKNPLSLLSSEKREHAWFKKGAIVLMGLLAVVFLLGGVGSFFTRPLKVMIKSKPSGASVHLGEERLGETPLEVELQGPDEKPVLSLDGFESKAIPDFSIPESGKAGKVYVVLEKTPFPIDWTGLPKGTRVWWNGEEEGKTRSTVAGEHKIKVKPPGQSSFVWSATVQWNKGEAFHAGRGVAEEIRRRPILVLSLSGIDRAEVIVKDGPRFTTTVSLGQVAAAITLPGPGTYMVKVEGSHRNGLFQREIVLKEGSKKSVDIALWQAASAPARATYHPGSPSPSRPRYNPPPSYPSSAGGRGRIAPPSF